MAIFVETVVIKPDSNPEYLPYVLLMMTLIASECYFTAFIQGARRKVFKSVMGEFFETHTRLYEGAPPETGHPDCGSGLYSSKLSYRDWFDYNSAVRVHMNFVEQLPIILVLIFLAGLKLPFETFILSVGYFICRLAYPYTYLSSGGPNARTLAVLPMALIRLTLYGISFYSVKCFIEVGHYNTTSSSN